MSKKTVEPSALSHIYRLALDACLALWPIFLIRIAFLFLNLMFLVFCLVVGFMPLIHFWMSNPGDLSGENLRNFLNGVGVLSWFGYPQACILALYVTCAIFLGAFFNGAVYGQLNRYQKGGEGFSVENFFMDGFQKTLPMMGLILVSIFVGVLMLGFGGILTVAVGVFIGKLLPWWFDVLLLLPAGLLFVLILSSYIAVFSLSAASLVDGQGLWESISNGISTAFRHKGRAIGAMFLLWLIYMVFLFAFSMVFSVLMLMPVVGILFAIFKFFVTAVLGLGMNIYMSSLSVALELEPQAFH